MKAILIFSIAMCLAGVAEARTVTLGAGGPVTVGDEFTAPPPADVPQIGWGGLGIHHYEQGFNYQTSDVYSGGPIMLTDDSGLVSSTLSHTNGRSFSLNSIDVSAWNNSAYVTGSGPQPTDPNDYDVWARDHFSSEMGWKIEGYRNGSVISSFFQSADRSSPLAYTNLSFGALFENMDSIVFSMVFPDGFTYDTGTPFEFGPNTTWCESFYCSQIDFANFVVTTVPLPAGLPMLGAGLGLMWMVRRRGRR